MLKTTASWHICGSERVCHLFCGHSGNLLHARWKKGLNMFAHHKLPPALLNANSDTQGVRLPALLLEVCFCERERKKKKSRTLVSGAWETRKVITWDQVVKAPPSLLRGMSRMLPKLEHVCFLSLTMKQEKLGRGNVLIWLSRYARTSMRIGDVIISCCISMAKKTWLKSLYMRINVSWMGFLGSAESSFYDVKVKVNIYGSTNSLTTDIKTQLELVCL